MVQQGTPGAGATPAWETELVELAPGVFAYVQAGGGLLISNGGLIAGGDASVAVDALFAPRMTRAFLDEAARVAAPIETLINTHHHIDHTLGNHAFAGRTIIAHALTRNEMRRTGSAADLRTRVSALAPHFAADMQEQFAIVLPNVGYEDRMTVYVDDRAVQLIHVPTAHTIDDTLVWLPEEKLLFAGDICFFYVTPLAFEGSILGWIRALGTVEALGAERIVPGHGPVGGAADLALLRGYFERLRDEARRHYDAGRPAEEAVMAIELGPYAEWGEPERIAPNVLRLYEDFSGRPWAPLDFAAFYGLQRAWLARR